MSSPVPLDRFAPTYIPQWQRPTLNIQEHFIPLPVPAQVSHRTYAAHLYPEPLLDYLEGNESDNRDACAKEWNVIHGNHIVASPTQSAYPAPPPPLPVLTTAATYATRWLMLLSREYTARLTALEQSTMYHIQLVPVPVPVRSGMNDVPLFSLSAPHIRENYPPISLNDTVWLRQMRPWNQTFQGIAFEARVHSLQRISGQVILRCDALAQPHLWESGVFNLQWVPQERHFKASRLALESIHAGITKSADSYPRHSVLRWLFPNSKDWDENRHDVITERPIEWIDTELNAEQKLAVESIVFGGHTIPYLISGPPGTGKTKTIVEAVLQILEHHPRTHILVCGASNSSADTIATRLISKLSPDVLLRLNDPSRPMDEVRLALHPWCWNENGSWAVPSMKYGPIIVYVVEANLLSKRVIVTSCIDASLLSSVRCSNASLSVLEDHIQTHLLAPEILPFPTNYHFGFLLVDEAAQASEAELCIPLSVVSPFPSPIAVTRQDVVSTNERVPHVTICGDPRQLGPRIESEECRSKGMDESLLQRLFERDVYHNSPYARHKETNLRLSTMKQTVSTPFCNLTKNYRSHPAILMLPSTLFYDDSLVAFAPMSTQHTPLAKWPALGADDFPFLFVGCTTPEEWTDEHLSYYNSGEISEVTQIVSGLLGLAGPEFKYHLPLADGPEINSLNLKPSQISVISPFREQVWRIRVALRTMGLGAVDVGDVESLQGAENRVVIVSTVRSSQRFLTEDQRLNRGIIFEAKRFNVALTRAKELLVIVGNGDVLKVDPWWKYLLTFAVRNKAYRGPQLSSIDPSSADAFSRLEEEWRSRRHGSQPQMPKMSNGHIQEDSDGFVIAGSVVRETLREV